VSFTLTTILSRHCRTRLTRSLSRRSTCTATILLHCRRTSFEKPISKFSFARIVNQSKFKIAVKHTFFLNNKYTFRGRLRVLNLSKNCLASLPLPAETAELNKLRELYVALNCLGDNCMDTIAAFTRLRVLHIAYNELHVLHDKCVVL
jgi:hypothetical protein